MADEPPIYLLPSAIIPDAKITKYLLVPLPKDDKSKFLAQAGYTLNNWRRLKEDIRVQILPQPAKLSEKTSYGDKYEIRTCL